MRPTVVVISVLLLAPWSGCAVRPAPQPIIEPSASRAPQGEQDAAEDLRLCESAVRESAPVTIQPRWLPPLGAPDNGAVLGTVEAPHQVWASQVAYREAIERCLTARGYEIRGWQ